MITIPVITECCAGIDIGKRELAVAIAVGPADKEAEIKTRSFGTTVPALTGLLAWLRQEGCTSVAMESTGSYWIPVKNILETDMKLILVCARKHHPKKGHKTDFRDAMDLAVHQRHGLLTGSYLPERKIVEFRDLTRRRKKLLGHLRSEKNRIQKVLETANVKIGNIVSDVFGVSGQEMLQALLDKAPLSAAEMAGMAKRRLRLKIPQLTEALQDHQMNDHHRWLIEQSIEHSKLLDLQTEALEKRIQSQLQPCQKQYELLMTIPGVKETTAAGILAEIGPHMEQFQTADHLCSWAGIRPGNNRSAGKSRSTHIKKANKFLLASLVEAAWGAARTRNSMFERKFRRWAKRLGRKKATIAICRSLLRVVWAVLRNDRPYREPDTQILRALETAKQVHHHARRLRELGADETAVHALVASVLENSASEASPGNAKAMPTAELSAGKHTESPRAVCSPKKRPTARGVLGFRIRTAPKEQYSVEKELSAGAPSQGRPRTKPDQKKQNSKPSSS